MEKYFLCLLIFLLPNPATAEDAYTLAANEWGTCVGEQMRYRYPPSITIADVIQVRCGKLQKKEQDEFSKFVTGQIGKVLTAETAFKIVIHATVSPAAILPGMIDAYKQAIAKKHQPTIPK